MNLETICTSLEMSKKLVKAGFEQECCFWWLEVEMDDDLRLVYIDHVEQKSLTRKYRELWSGQDYYPAYTFEQLFNAIPEELKEVFKFSAIEYDDKYLWEFDGINDTTDTWYEFGNKNNMADASAQALLWCIKNNYYKSTK